MDQKLIAHPDCGYTWLRFRPILDGSMRTHLAAFSEESASSLEYTEYLTVYAVGEQMIYDLVKTLFLDLARKRGLRIVDSESGWSSLNEWISVESHSLA